MRRRRALALLGFVATGASPAAAFPGLGATGDGWSWPWKWAGDAALNTALVDAFGGAVDVERLGGGRWVAVPATRARRAPTMRLWARNASSA